MYAHLRGICTILMIEMPLLPTSAETKLASGKNCAGP
ncbi:hypothetical protein RSAG8_00447, partial [Rhizoctonia solani AG-8 WAC10335]